MDRRALWQSRGHPGRAGAPPEWGQVPGLLLTRKAHCRGRGARQRPPEARHRLPSSPRAATSCMLWVVLRETPLGLSTRDFEGSGSQEPLPGAPVFQTPRRTQRASFQHLTTFCPNSRGAVKVMRPPGIQFRLLPAEDVCLGLLCGLFPARVSVPATGGRE